MRSFGRMLLLLLCGATFITIAATATTSSISRSWPVVFGFEFTMTGIVTSAGLPNGTIVPIGITQGSAAYRTEMNRLYSICEGTARTAILPAVAQEYRTEGAPFRWRSMELYRWIGGPVTELSQVVTAAKRNALDTLSEQHGVTDLDVNEVFHASITAPQFIFTALDSVSTRCPHDNCELNSLEFESETDVEYMFLARAWQSIMAAQFSQAVVKAGFYRSTIPYTATPKYFGNYPQPYDDFEFVYPAASHAICAAGIGTCRLKTLGIEHSYGRKPPGRCQSAESVIVVADLQDTGLSLWAEGIDDCYLSSIPWNTWTELKPPSPEKVAAWSRNVDRRISQLLKDTSSNTSIGNAVRVIPAGPSWTPPLLEGMKHSSAFTFRNISQPEFAASINTAKIARWEERSLSTDWNFRQQTTPEADVAYFDNRAFVSAWEGELWPPQEFCSKAQKWEKPCKWTDAPVCPLWRKHCRCPSIWEMGGRDRRRELHRINWEARRAVMWRLGGMCKVRGRDVCEHSEMLPNVVRKNT